jgi:hypothetical protein
VGTYAARPQDPAAALLQHAPHVHQLHAEHRGEALLVARQTGTSLDMIEKHYGRAKVVAEELDELITEAEERAATSRATPSQTRNLRGRQKESIQPEERNPRRIGGFCESGRPGSNRRRPAWEAGILPLNYARA